MVTVPFPYGRGDSKRVGRMDFKAHAPDRISDVNERRHRAELERALRAGDDALAQMERRLKEAEARIAALEAIVNP